MLHLRAGDLDEAVSFYRSTLERSGNVYANSFISVVLAYAQKVSSKSFQVQSGNFRWWSWGIEKNKPLTLPVCSQSESVAYAVGVQFKTPLQEKNMPFIKKFSLNGCELVIASWIQQILVKLLPESVVLTEMDEAENFGRSWSVNYRPASVLYRYLTEKSFF